MASIVISVLGDDRAGLVEALAGAIAARGGNWDRSHMAELAGKFAGIVLVTVPDESADSLIRDLEALETDGLLDVSAERALETGADAPVQHLALELVGQDHPGIVHEVSSVLASRGVSIDELETEVGPAPQGGNLFTARASLEVPADISIEDIRSALEAVAHDLMVDLVVSNEP